MSTITSEHTQRLQALEKADKVRFAWATLKRQIRQGEVSVADAIYDDCAQKHFVCELLEAQYRWGPLKAYRCLNYDLELLPWQKVSELSGPQRRAVVEHFA